MHADLSLGYGAAPRTAASRATGCARRCSRSPAGQATIVSHDEKSWASITFAGTRHRLELAFEGAEAVEAGELFIAFLPEHEFAIPGQLVADAAVTAVDHRARAAAAAGQLRAAAARGRR